MSQNKKCMHTLFSQGKKREKWINANIKDTVFRVNGEQRLRITCIKPTSIEWVNATEMGYLNHLLYNKNCFSQDVQIIKTWTLQAGLTKYDKKNKMQNTVSDQLCKKYFIKISSSTQKLGRQILLTTQKEKRSCKAGFYLQNIHRSMLW